ncbi:hypothetical protein Tco_1107300 [Tanacetum coccineum]
MHVIEQPLPPAPEAGAEPNIVAQWTALSMMLHKQNCFLCLEDISVGLILNGLTKDFVGFVRNYNMHNMGKTIGEIHAMLIEYEKGLPKKAETPQVMMNSTTLEKEFVLVYLAELQKRGKQVGLCQFFGIERKLKQGSSLLVRGNDFPVAQVEAIKDLT